MYKGASRAVSHGAGSQAGTNKHILTSVTQAEYIAERLRKPSHGGSQTAEAISYQRARVTLRYFPFERAEGAVHTYTDSER